MSKGKKILSVLLAVFLLASCLPMTVSAADTAYYSGAPAGRSYTISAADQMKALAETVNGGEDYEGTTFTMTQDIDLNGSENNQWTPIGQVLSFNGIFDGGNHKITGLYINHLYLHEPEELDDLMFAALFGFLGDGGTVKNLTVDGSVTLNCNGDTHWAACASGVVAYNLGTVKNCHNNAKISAGGRVLIAGGIVGYNFDYSSKGTVSDCSNTGTIISEGEAGGIVGDNFVDGKVIWNCFNSGTITGDCAGGIVGIFDRGSEGCTMENCYNTGNVTGTQEAGGIAGHSGAFTVVKNCYNIGKVSGSTNVGGVAGNNESSGFGDSDDRFATVENCYYLTGTAAGGIKGKDVAGQAEKLTADAFKLTSSFKNWDFTSVWEMGKDANGNDVRPILKNPKETNLKSLSSGATPDNPGNPGGPSDAEDPDDPGEKPSASKFTDVPATEYYYNAVNWAVENEIVAGTSATTFSPNQNCTRGQIVTFLWRAAGKPEPKTTVNPFTDVKSSEYYYKAVLWAFENNIVAGTSAATFSPNQNCTRGQIVTFLWRAAEKPEPKTTVNPFSDVKSSEYYYKAVLWAHENKIVAGTSADKFSPNSTCTRAQAVTFLYRDMGK